ncbi:MAG: type II toxin-antitoxin system HicA family toxin [Chitinophagaceae bacterium]|nr:type II toxin-antitoxin system HicA family toxin [Chitinophagaceae bacterium]
MPKLYSSEHILKVLYSLEFVFVSQKGSHIKLRKIGNPTLTVIIPADRKEIPFGTFRSICRQANLDVKDFK